MNDRAIPADAYVQMGLDQIEEGGFRKRVDEAIAKSLTQLLDWEQATLRKDGVAVVTAKVKLKRIKGIEEFMSIECSVTCSVPTVTTATSAVLAGDKIVCQIDGTSTDDPTQMRLFDAKGQPFGTIDRATGEVRPEAEPEDDPEPDVAGKIRQG